MTTTAIGCLRLVLGLAERFGWDESAGVVADLLHQVERATNRR